MLELTKIYSKTLKSFYYANNKEIEKNIKLNVFFFSISDLHKIK